MTKGYIMKVLIILGIIIASVGCTEEIRKPVPAKEVSKKYCINECLKSVFSDFHHEGSSWGTGSSSMNGLSQEKIFDRVIKYCDDFYKEEKCCEPGDSLYSSFYGLNTIHSFKYGACK